jgi:ATP-dependent DNA helicase RecG
MVEIFDDRVEISNPGELLVDKKKFGKKAVSIARNPILFDIFHRLQLIEKVGTGIKRILAAIKVRNLKVEFDFDNFFSIIFKRPALEMVQRKEYEAKQIEIEPIEEPRQYPASTLQALNKWGWTWDKFNDFVPSLSQVCPKSVPSEIAAVILISAQEETDMMNLMKILNRTNRTRFRKLFLNPLIEAGFIEFTIPGKPRSSQQKYIISEKGKNLLKKYQDQ